MSDSVLLNLVATGHAIDHANKRESWTCSCLACRFTKEYKIKVQEKNGEIGEMTVAEAIVETLGKQGKTLSI